MPYAVWLQVGEDPDDMYGLTRKAGKSNLAVKHGARSSGQDRKGPGMKREKVLDRKDPKILAKRTQGSKADSSKQGRQGSKSRRKDTR